MTGTDDDIRCPRQREQQSHQNDLTKDLIHLGVPIRSKRYANCEIRVEATQVLNPSTRRDLSMPLTVQRFRNRNRLRSIHTTKPPERVNR